MGQELENNKLTDREAKRLHWWIIFFLVIGILAPILHALPRADKLSTAKTHVHIGGRDFAVPNEYFRGPKNHEQESKQLYIWVMRPDYSPYRGEFNKARDLDELNPIWERHVSVLIDDTAYTTDLRFRYNVTRNGLPGGPEQPRDLPDIYGLRHTLVYRSSSRYPEPFFSTDLFYKINGNVVQSYARCTQDTTNNQRHPMCDAFFQDGRLLYQLGYRKTGLAQFSDIQSHIHDLIESFSCVPKNSNQSLSLQKSEKGVQICPP